MPGPGWRPASGSGRRSCSAGWCSGPSAASGTASTRLRLPRRDDDYRHSVRFKEHRQPMIWMSSNAFGENDERRTRRVLTGAWTLQRRHPDDKERPQCLHPYGGGERTTGDYTRNSTSCAMTIDNPHHHVVGLLLISRPSVHRRNRNGPALRPET